MFGSQIQQLEADMRPLKDSIQSLTTQKDALLAEKTALKNEVLFYFCPFFKPL